VYVIETALQDSAALTPVEQIVESAFLDKHVLMEYVLEPAHLNVLAKSMELPRPVAGTDVAEIVEAVLITLDAKMDNVFATPTVRTRTADQTDAEGHVEPVLIQKKDQHSAERRTQPSQERATLFVTFVETKYAQTLRLQSKLARFLPVKLGALRIVVRSLVSFLSPLVNSIN
jgi:hypothetical protein